MQVEYNTVYHGIIKKQMKKEFLSDHPLKSDPNRKGSSIDTTYHHHLSIVHSYVIV